MADEVVAITVTDVEQAALGELAHAPVIRLWDVLYKVWCALPVGSSEEDQP